MSFQFAPLFKNVQNTLSAGPEKLTAQGRDIALFCTINKVKFCVIAWEIGGCPSSLEVFPLLSKVTVV
eukprot:m.96406 g.96406  ORF g.96406 m.96406 type:complete len:68 (-) comp12362_c0_seq2:1212-1415(-)